MLLLLLGVTAVVKEAFCSIPATCAHGTGQRRRPVERAVPRKVMLLLPLLLLVAVVEREHSTG